MKEEERISADFVRTYQLDPTAGADMHPRKRVYVNNDKAIKILVSGFDLIANPTPDQDADHLGALQYRLASNGFDNWDN